jgi:CubicO group peptidase (beta-lactamase class C family)
VKPFACLVLTTAWVLASPSVAPADPVDDYVRGEMKKQSIPGLSLAVVRDGQVLKAQGYGLANVELDVPATARTVYQSGSLGKQFTATAVMTLVEEGKVGLDDHITRYFPGAPAAWKDITVRHLLTHTSGIPRGDDKLDRRKDYTEDELVKFAASLPLDFATGEKWKYSNTGYALLGVLIHKASGKFYGDLLHEKVFAPLHMDTTRIISEADIVPNRAAGYRLVKGALKNQEWVSPSLNTTADGSLYLTVLDLVKWDAALYTEQLLKRSSLDAMWTPVRLKDGTTHPYGFGWAVGRDHGHRVVEHGGAWQGFTSYIARYVDDRLTVIVLTNLAGVNPGRIAHAVAGIYVPALKPAAPRSIEDKEPQVTALVREVTTQLGQGKLDERRFTPDFRATLAAQRQRLAEDIRAWGRLKSVTLVERKQQGDLRLYQYRMEFEEVTVRARYALTKDDRIAGLVLEPE